MGFIHFWVNMAEKEIEVHRRVIQMAISMIQMANDDRPMQSACLFLRQCLGIVWELNELVGSLLRCFLIVALLMSSRGHLFVNHDCYMYIPKCLSLCRFQTWFLQIFLSTFKVKVKGQRFRIKWVNDYVMIYGQHCVNIWSKPNNIER